MTKQQPSKPEIAIYYPPDGIKTIGRIAAGTPLEAIEDHQREALQALLSAPGRYALKICDDSMIEAGIFSGDTLIVQSQQQACNGDIVVVLIDNEQVAVKRIRYRGTERLQLFSDHPGIDDWNLARSRVVIQGKVIGQIRRYR